MPTISLHISPVLSGQGQRDYVNLLREAIQSGSDKTLAEHLKQHRRINKTQSRKNPKGGFSIAAVPANAAEVLAESEFNRDEVLEVFDRTFAITGALQFLAIVVAFTGILSALLSWHLDKQREIGILRSIGLTTRQMWRLIMLESGLLGGVAGLLALPTGYTLALILIYIINKRSFGWTLQMQLEPDPFIQALVLSILAALLASIYPAFKISQSATVEALRSE